jgi:hypothetical protein
MNRQDHDRPAAGRGPAHWMAGLLLAGGVASWLVAALLRWGLAPLVVAEPALAGTRRAAGATAVADVVGLFAPVGAMAGAAVLVGLALTWRRPQQAAGRVLLLVAGLLAIAAGLLLGTIGFFEIGWGDGVAVAGLAGAAAFVAVGLLACVASLTDRLPGASLVERMMEPSTAPPTTAAWERMLPPTAALVVGWVVSTGAVLARGDMAFVGFMTAQLGLPILAGAFAAGWREGEPNRLKTLGWASAAGMVMDWLFLLALALGQYYHNLDGAPYTPRSYVVWWGLTGALLGAFGYSLWGPLTRRTRRGPRRRPRPL